MPFELLIMLCSGCSVYLVVRSSVIFNKFFLCTFVVTGHELCDYYH